MEKKVYKKATMQVVKVECESQLLSGSDTALTAVQTLSGTSSVWMDLQ